MRRADAIGLAPFDWLALVTLLLVEKSRLHALIRQIDDVGLRAGFRFEVLALVVLPLVPPDPFGAWGGSRPREFIDRGRAIKILDRSRARHQIS